MLSSVALISLANFKLEYNVDNKNFCNLRLLWSPDLFLFNYLSSLTIYSSKIIYDNHLKSISQSTPISSMQVLQRTHPIPPQPPLQPPSPCCPPHLSCTEAASSIGITRWPLSRAWKRTGCASPIACPCVGRDALRTRDGSYHPLARTTIRRIRIVTEMETAEHNQHKSME